MSLADFSIDLKAVMDEGKILLINLKQSEHLSYEAARTFGALLVNDFFECAIQRKSTRPNRDPDPYFLYLDEFQNFLPLDICRMLAEVRKRGLFLILAHQYFEQLDEEITAAALNNCQIKAVFGGLSTFNARRIAEELFIGKLNPKKVKVCIYQTKFWPEYRRDKVYTKGTTHTSGTSHSSSSGTTQNSGTSSSTTMGTSTMYFEGSDWFPFPQATGQSSESRSTASGYSSSSGSSTSSSSTDSDSFGESESEADIPILIPVPFQELSSIQYYSLDEQLTELTAALKNQFQRHCFIQIRQQETQPMLVPFVEPVTTFIYYRHNLDWYIELQHQKQKALPAAEVDRLLDAQETALLNAARPPAVPAQVEMVAEASPPEPVIDITTTPIWNRNAAPVERKRGPKPDSENHTKVVRIISAYGEQWTTDDNLLEVCEEFDRQNIPVPKTWATRMDGQSRSWCRAYQNYPHLVVKTVKDRCKAAQAVTPK